MVNQDFENAKNDYEFSRLYIEPLKFISLMGSVCIFINCWQTNFKLSTSLYAILSLSLIVWSLNKLFKKNAITTETYKKLLAEKIIDEAI